MRLYNRSLSRVPLPGVGDRRCVENRLCLFFYPLGVLRVTYGEISTRANVRRNHLQCNLGDDVLSVRPGACREKDRRLILYHRTATMHRAGKLERNSAVSPVIVPSMTKSYRARCLPIDRAFRRTASSRAHSACRGPQLPEIRCQPGLCRFVSTTTLSFARLRAYSALGACAHSVNQSNHGNFVS